MKKRETVKWKIYANSSIDLFKLWGRFAKGEPLMFILVLTKIAHTLMLLMDKFITK